MEGNGAVPGYTFPQEHMVRLCQLEEHHIQAKEPAAVEETLPAAVPAAAGPAAAGPATEPAAWIQQSGRLHPAKHQTQCFTASVQRRHLRRLEPGQVPETNGGLHNQGRQTAAPRLQSQARPVQT